MPIEWSGLAPELLLALDRRSGDPLHSYDLPRRVTLRDEPDSTDGGVREPRHRVPGVVLRFPRFCLLLHGRELARAASTGNNGTARASWQARAVAVSGASPEGRLRPSPVTDHRVKLTDLLGCLA